MSIAHRSPTTGFDSRRIPSGSVTGGPRIAVWETLKRVIPVEGKVFGEIPWSTYSVMQIADPSFGGGSGLEHQNSHVDIYGPSLLGSPVIHSIYAHEIFHSWNVKRLRPARSLPIPVRSAAADDAPVDQRRNHRLLRRSRGDARRRARCERLLRRDGRQDLAGR